MAESAIYLYRFNPMQKEFNYYLDDMSIFGTSTNVVYSSIEFQYQQIDREMFVKIPVAQANQAIYANYCRIVQDDRDWYFFVTSVKWRGQSTLEIHLEMDVMNTFRIGTDYLFDKRTHIKRQHKNRWTRTGNYLNPIIDRYTENLSPTLITKSRTIIKDTCDWADKDKNFYAVFAGSVTERTIGSIKYSDTSIKCYFYREKDGDSISEHAITYGGTQHNFYIPVDGSAHDTIFMTSSTALIVNCPYKPFTLNSSGNIDDGRFFVADNTSDSYLKSVNADNDCLAYNVVWGGYTVPQRVSGLRNENLPAVSLSDYIVVHSVDKDDTRDIRFESKLLNSEFSFHKFIYGTDEYAIQYEYFHNQHGYTASPTVTPAFILAADLSGEMFFTFRYSAGYTYDDESTDNQQYMIITRSNNKTIMSYDYTSYINIQSQYDQKELTLSRVNTGINIAHSAANMAMAYASGNAAVSVSGQASGLTSISAAFISRIKDEIAYEKKLEMLKTSQVSASASNGVDAFLLTYGGDEGGKLKYCTGAPRDEVRNLIYEYLFRYGYTDNTYGIPDVNTRYRFNYLECDAYLRSAKVPVQFLDMLKEKYRQGVTFMHYHDGEYDWGFQYENWETSLL